MLHRRQFVGIAAASALVPPLFTRSAPAQAVARDAVARDAWPNRLVRIICPIAPGGGIDAVTRLVAARLSEIWRQQVVVENRTGGSNNIAAEAVARSEPDGTTIFASIGSSFLELAIASRTCMASFSAANF